MTRLIFFCLLASLLFATDQPVTYDEFYHVFLPDTPREYDGYIVGGGSQVAPYSPIAFWMKSKVIILSDGAIVRAIHKNLDTLLETSRYVPDEEPQQRVKVESREELEMLEEAEWGKDRAVVDTTSKFDAWELYPSQPRLEDLERRVEELEREVYGE